jgi:diacylglycerol kinase family enzyme
MSEFISPPRDSAISVSQNSTKHGPVPPYLATNVSVHVLISVLSGSHGAEDFFNTNIKPELDGIHPVYNVTLTKSPSTITEYTKSTIYPAALAGEPQTIILLSGDGGISDIVDTLHSCIIISGTTAKSYTPPNIALLPLGTGNALAHSTNLGDLKHAATRVFAGTPRAIPTFSVSFSPGAQLLSNEGQTRTPITDPLHGCVVFSWGLHASLVHISDTPANRVHGAARFKMAAQALLKDPHAYRGRVSLLQGPTGGRKVWNVLNHAEDEEDRHSYVLATLVSRLEEGFVISPETTPLSCNLRVVAMPLMTGAELGRLLGLAYQGGKHVGEKGVRYEEVDGVRIEMQEGEGQGEWRVVCVDGKIVEVAEGGWVEVLREGEEGRVAGLIC